MSFLAPVSYADAVHYNANESLWETGLLTKNKVWAYENEFRLLYFTENSCGTEGSFIDLEDQITIESITFGYKTPESEKQQIYELFSEAERKKIGFYEIFVDRKRNEYGLLRRMYEHK